MSHRIVLKDAWKVYKEDQDKILTPVDSQVPGRYGTCY